MGVSANAIDRDWFNSNASIEFIEDVPDDIYVYEHAGAHKALFVRVDVGTLAVPRLPVPFSSKVEPSLKKQKISHDETDGSMHQLLRSNETSSPDGPMAS